MRMCWYLQRAHSSNTACTMSSHADYSRLKVNDSHYETKIKKDGGAVMAKKSRKLGDAFMAGNLFMCLSIVVSCNENHASVAHTQ